MLKLSNEHMETLRSRVVEHEQNVGPVLNHLSTAVYGRVQAELASRSFGVDRIDTYGNLNSMTNELHDRTRSSLDRMLASRDDLREVVTDLFQLRCSDNGGIGASLSTGGAYVLHYANSTFAGTFEGINTGLVMPLQVYRHKQMEMGRAIESSSPLEADQLAVDLRDKHFQASLLGLSRSANGTFGAGSSDSSILYYESPLKNIGVSTVFERKGYGLRKDTRRALEHLITSHYEAGVSEGCPVRKSGYPKLGEVALRYCEVMKIEPKALRLQGSSAIVTACGLLADTIESIID